MDNIYKSTREMPGPVSAGAMVCTLPGTLLPCAGNMVIVKVLVVVVMVMVVRVIMMATMIMVVMMVVNMVIVILAGIDRDDSHNRSRGLLGIRSSFNVVECAVLSLKKMQVSIRTFFLAALICDV